MTFKKLIAILLFVLLGAVTPAHAQQYTLSNTTLNGAITATATTLVLTSASASSGSSFGAPAAGQCLFIDNELMRITATSSTTMTVQRGTVDRGPHKTLAVVWTGACGAFKSVDPPNQGDNQVCSSMPAPWINTNTGNIWWCNTANNTLRGTNFAVFTYNSVPVGQ